eukprot:TRINITY_DN5925_c0_g1_i1.p1 TRINITY_DN5925_c0_g1~~TRINITY_DN5925_c0_g1_i1.p1  ORF type:complete len:580 (+),score=102.70 TRINITY_DN5925_c0_g1_i1:45-1742(+)
MSSTASCPSSTRSSQPVIGNSAQVTADQLDHIVAALREAVADAVGGSMLAATQKLELQLQTTLSSRLESINFAAGNPRVVKEEDARSSGSQKSGRKALNTLEQVSDQLFCEALGDRSQPCMSPKIGESSSSKLNSAASSKKYRERQCEQPNLGSSQREDGANGTLSNVGAHSQVVGKPCQVVPCELEHNVGAMVVKERRSSTLASTCSFVQDFIITDSCKAVPESQAHLVRVPLIDCVIRKSFRCRMVLFFTALLHAGLLLVLWLQYSAPIDPLRDSAAWILAIAAGVSSTQLTRATEFIEHATCWAVENASTETWVISSRKKQRWLLVWWAFSLLSVASGLDRVTQVEVEHDDLRSACLWASRITTWLIITLSSTLLIIAASLQSHIISALDVFIDAWSCELCDKWDFAEGVLTWNTAQALIRRAGSVFENAFITIQTASLLGLVLVATQWISFVLQSDWSWSGLVDIHCTLPMLWLASLAGSLLLQCASITDKCSLLAPLINQITTDAMDTGRQYLVRYLSDSAAGIYVQGVKLDMMMVANIVYFLAVAVSGFFGFAIRFLEQ